MQDRVVLACVCLCLHSWMHVCGYNKHVYVCVKLPLLAFLYFPCRDTDSPSDKPHLHLQSQLLRLSLFSLISKLPLIPSVLYLAALSYSAPHGNQMLHQPASTYIYTNVCWANSPPALRGTYICMHACELNGCDGHSVILFHSFSLKWTLNLNFSIYNFIHFISFHHHSPSLLPLFIFPSVTIAPFILSVPPALSPVDSFLSYNNKHRLCIEVTAKSNWLMKVSIDLEV